MDSGYSPDTVLGTWDNEVYDIINPIFPYFLYYKGETGPSNEGLSTK